MKIEFNIDKSQVMRVSRSNDLWQIKVNNRELKEVDHFKYLGSVPTRDGYCTRENIELKKKLVRCYVWSRDLDPKKIGTELFVEL